MAAVYGERAKGGLLRPGRGPKFGEGHVSSEHLFLGILRQDDSMAVRILARLGADRARLREEMERRLPKDDRRPSPDMTLTPRAKKIIDLAYDEAQNLHHNYMGTEHLLLGLLREGDGLACHVLQESGVTLEAARKAFLDLAEEDVRTAPAKPAPGPLVPPDDPWLVYTGAAKRAIDVAESECLERGGIYICPEHLLLGVLEDPDGVAARALKGIGVEAERLRAEIVRRCRVSGPPLEGEASFSYATQRALQIAMAERHRLGPTKLTPDHFLLGLLQEPDGVAGRVLSDFGVKTEPLRIAIRNARLA